MHFVIHMHYIPFGYGDLMSGCERRECLSLCCQDMRNAVGDLSMKLNKIESSLREFEKQRVNPKFEEVRKFELDHEHRIKDIEYRLGHIIELPSELDIRLQECERLLDKWADKIVGKKPHRCPVCDGCGNSMGTRKNNPNFEFHDQYASCHTCEGKGIVWG